MFAVIFAVHPGRGKKGDYLALVKSLRPMLEKIDGFIDNERFESKSREGWVLSLSTWRDEKAQGRYCARRAVDACSGRANLERSIVVART